MRPSICELIVPTIYNKLLNHASVLQYPPVRGVEASMFFVSHKEPEDQIDTETGVSLKLLIILLI